MEPFTDYYEVLQVSPKADTETIEKVYRHLAKRYHPDNRESGDSERFRTLSEAFHILIDPEKRAAYDASHDSYQKERWKILKTAAAPDLIQSDSAAHRGILTLLYTARRQDALKPGLGSFEIGRLIDCPDKHLDFHLWYLREKGLIHLTDSGQYAVTVQGVDAVLENGYLTKRDRLLTEGIGEGLGREDDGPFPPAGSTRSS